MSAYGSRINRTPNIDRLARDRALFRNCFAGGTRGLSAKPTWDPVATLSSVFTRLLPDGRLDKTDSYTSDWIGEPSEKPPQTLGGTGAPVLGVYGRKAAVLDAVGLMLPFAGKSTQ